VVADVEAVLRVLEIKTERRERAGCLWGLCPFHADTSPSWRIRVDPDHERYGQHHCFACQSGGTLAELVSHVRGITLSGAYDWLDEFNEKVHVVQREVPGVRVEMTTAERVFRMPPEVIFARWEDWVSPARKYLEERGVTKRQVDMFGIGYAVDGRLAGRIVFTVLDPATMSPVSYMARDFSGSRRAKRYLWPASEENADSDMMFGEHLWTFPAYRTDIVVTEGAFNALAVERALLGPNRVTVGALGTSALRDEHAGKLATFKRVIVLTDADPAGDKAANELHTALARHTRVTRVRLATGKDANDLSVEDLRASLWPALITPPPT